MAKALLFGLIGVAMGLHLQEDRAHLASMSFSLQSDSGLFLASCKQCDRFSPQNATLRQTDPKIDAQAVWVIEKVDSSVVIKNLLGSPLIDPQAGGPVVVQKRNGFSTGDDLWTPKRLANGKWVFATQSGQGFLGRCAEQGQSDFPCVISATGPRDIPDSPRVQWTVKASA